MSNNVEIISPPKVHVTITSTFTHNDSKSTNRIVPLPGDKAIVRKLDDENTYHVDEKGKEVKREPHSSGYFMKLDDNNIYISSFNEMTIRCFTSSSTESSITYSTTPLHPTGICKFNDGLLVALCKSKTDEINDNSCGELHYVTTSGKVIMKYYSYTEGRECTSFTHPMIVVQNTNGDVCLVEYINREFSSCLVVMSTSSEKRFIYTGLPDLKEKFTCYDIACDNQHRILVADLHNHAVHLLSKNGQFIQYVLMGQSSIFGPRCLGLDLHCGKLWVGDSNGVVRVYTYSDEFSN